MLKLFKLNRLTFGSGGWWMVGVGLGCLILRMLLLLVRTPSDIGRFVFNDNILLEQILIATATILPLRKSRPRVGILWAYFPVHNS